MRITTGLALCASLLSACGGGAGSGTTMTPVGWTSGVFQSAATFANKCAAPRTGVDPFSHMAYPDRAGMILDENNWLRSWTNDLYLWFNEVTDQNPAMFTRTDAYFKVLRTNLTTTSGAPKDKFHFTYPTADWEALSQGGVQLGYGAQWLLISTRPPRQALVAYTEPGSPAAGAPANLARGAEVLSVDGVDLVNGSDVNTLNAGLFPSTTMPHTFVIRDQPGGATRSVTMTPESITSHPVQNVATIPTATGSTGYMLFNDHLATSEAALVSAFTTLQAAGVTDLVLDIRYNGGGYLDIASEVAYMVAGPGRTSGMTFEVTQFNSKYPTMDPVTAQAITPVPFESTSQGFAPNLLARGQALPTLNLPRVFVLTGPDTCSASEAIINGLSGIGVTVVQIGSTTCGKPYGFYPQDNCGTTYFSIEFRGVNAMNFGDYTDGFSPQNAPAPGNAILSGCSVADDFTHALGDPAEGRLAAALNYMAGGSCPLPATGLARSLMAQQASAVDGRLPDSPLRNLRILRR